jgi:hypothetical protein
MIGSACGVSLRRVSRHVGTDVTLAVLVELRIINTLIAIIRLERQKPTFGTNTSLSTFRLPRVKSLGINTLCKLM